MGVIATGTLHLEQALKPGKGDIIAGRIAPGRGAEVVEFAPDVVGFFYGPLLRSEVGESAQDLHPISFQFTREV